MKKHLFIKISGCIILLIFAIIAILNINKSESNIGNFGLHNNNPIQHLYVDNNKLYIEVNNEVTAFCAKTTKSIPESDSLCWKDIDNNEANISVYHHKKYYVWVKDKDNNIIESRIINVD